MSRLPSSSDIWRIHVSEAESCAPLVPTSRCVGRAAGCRVSRYQGKDLPDQDRAGRRETSGIKRCALLASGFPSNEGARHESRRASPSGGRIVGIVGNPNSSHCSLSSLAMQVRSSFDCFRLTLMFPHRRFGCGGQNLHKYPKVDALLPQQIPP